MPPALPLAAAGALAFAPAGAAEEWRFDTAGEWRRCRLPLAALAPLGEGTLRAAPVLFPYWDDGSFSAGFAGEVPARLRPLFQGRSPWKRGPHYPHLTEAADSRAFSLDASNHRPPPLMPEETP